jgi:hypothetical protein
MPLQKLPPQGLPGVDPQVAKCRQLQERRRTLQTISELSATGGTQSPFRISTTTGRMPLVDFAGSPGNVRKIPNLNKRQSLPQYCARPECAQTRSPPTLSSGHTQNVQHTAIGNGIHTTTPPRREAGWNARREQARMQAEQALSGANMQREASNSSLKNGGSYTTAPLLPRTKTSQPYLRSYYSQQHLLHNSRSMTGTPSRSEQSCSSGRSLRQTDPRECDVESSERASTDSSSFRSSHDSTMRRSRSSSSSQSVTLQDVPPLPSGCARPPQSYYSGLTSHYHNGYPVQLPGPMYARSPSEMRTTSLPYMHVDHVNTPLLGSNFGVAPVIIMSPHKQHHSHVHKPRSKSLSARSTSSHQQTPKKHTPMSSTTSGSSLPSQRSRHSSQDTCLSSLSSSTRGRPSSLKSPAPAHLPRKRGGTTTVTFDQPPTHRAIPDRESLTKWKTEREEAKAEFDGMQRAKMKERVRRANEMEQEKEKELQAVGKGASKGARVLGMGLKKEKGRGCFGGWFGRILGKWR